MSPIPMQYLPSDDTSNPGSQAQINDPGELVHFPPSQNPRSAHSSTSKK